MTKWKAMLAAGALSLAATLPAAAAVTLNVVDGYLIGASGVTVATAAGTKTYNVEFLDGSCVSLFSNCAADPASSSLPPFAFTTMADALAASQSLLDQVFVDSAQGLFDSGFPLNIRGCSPISCYIGTPFGFQGTEYIAVIGALLETGLTPLDSQTSSKSTASTLTFQRMVVLKLTLAGPKSPPCHFRPARRSSSPALRPSLAFAGNGAKRRSDPPNPAEGPKAGC